MTAPARTGAQLANPFPGLRPFREHEEHLFFGRESQVDAMVDALARARFLAVVGTSGSGKSSLVNCGLIPALRRGLMGSAGTSWRVTRFRPGGDPIRSMSQSLARPGVLFQDHFEGLGIDEIAEATLRMSKLGLVDLYEQAHADEKPNLLIIADQFEELFRFRTLRSSGGDAFDSAENSVALVNLLLEAANSGLPIYIVLTMRSDFLGDCAQFPGLPEAINRGEYLVPRMSREERKAAITGPVAVAGAEISPVLLTRLVNDVGDNPDQLSILQHALNRTWSRWQREGGGVGPVALQHYEAIGTMQHALDWHAEKAFGELTGERQKQVCERVFQALTDKGTDARGIRRPTSLATLCSITEAEPDEVIKVIDVFRKPSRSFLMPPLSETLTPSTIVDISHESLMRIWNRLKSWAEEEAESASHYQRLVQNMVLHAKGAAGLMTDPELSLMLDWQQHRRPNAAWGERYHGDFGKALAFLEDSREARDAARAAEQERQRRELRRTRQIAGVLGTALLLAVLFGGYALYEQRRATAEQVARKQSDALADAQHQLAQEQERARTQAEALNQKLSVALDEAEKAKAEAEDADARAEHERDLATRNAQLFITAIKAQASAQLANFEQFEKAERLQLDSDAKKDEPTLTRDLQELEVATKNSKELSLDAAGKSALAAAIIANGSLITSDHISGSDLFDVSNGTQVTGNSGANHPPDMFSVSQASPERATVFQDGQPVGFTHWIEWKTGKEVSVQSVALFAAHDAIRLRRAFSTFKLYARGQNGWTKIAEYSPALMYGGSCASQPCFPPAIKYAAGTFLGACINVPETRAKEFRAEFVQSVSALEKFSGPRVIQIDGYRNANCSK